jgi:hypothetical protein
MPRLACAPIIAPSTSFGGPARLMLTTGTFCPAIQSSAETRLEVVAPFAPLSL